MQGNKFVIVSDYFAENVRGGAELSTQALIDSCDGEVVRIQSLELSVEEIDKYADHYWIFTNVWKMKWCLIPLMIERLRYSIVEYDFKYCAYRSPDMHTVAEGIECHCTNIILDDFFGNADICFFMSRLQMQWHQDKMPHLKSKTCYVLSSIFDDKTINSLATLSLNEKEDCWAIVWSASALKGFNEAVRYAEENGLNYKIFKDLNYEEMLEALSRCKGLIYKPIGGDTCPRMVIEAKLMGLLLDLNYFVMHKNEEWFCGDLDSTFRYLKNNKNFFWLEVKNVIRKEVNV